MKQKKSTYTLEEAKRSLEKYCVYQDRCHKDIERKLMDMRMIPEARELILLHLMQHDFLNEERFARSFARGKFKIKKWGYVRITNELKIREISSYNIKAALSEIDKSEYEETLRDLGKRKFNSTSEPVVLKKRKKVADYLLRRGFESPKVYALIRELELENNSSK
ncbi:RecX family transcriptional regulator [Lutimonas saemankumensis]|uniref:regulatory protein RecX n=1 Tax=Lutimonas saemankumensis TaxID=483016 RepID=UPI001CD76B4D|nr:regulatory protein RecX [Lutimonas saemankumensis]MCA0932392.1 RecX family transcriptional regulator [Lutimonas saemankumensis]